MNNFWLTLQSQVGFYAASFFEVLPVSRLISLSVISVLIGMLFVYLYSFISFQSALAKLKKKIMAAALEPFLFRDSLLLSVTSPARIFILGLKYLALCLPPLAILALPMLWMLGFLNQGYGYRALNPGDKVFLTIETVSSRDVRSLNLSSDLKGAEITDLVKAPLQNKSFAELRVTSDSPTGNISISNQQQKISINLPSKAYTVPVITSKGFEKLIFPGAGDKLPEGIKQIEFEYPANYFDSELPVEMHWLIVFFVLSVFSGLVFAKYAAIEV